MDVRSRPLSIREKIDFDRVFDEGSYIIFYSSSFNPYPDKLVSIDRTTVNVLSAREDVLLSVSFSRAENHIEFNSREIGQLWGRDERVTLQGVFNKTDVTIAIRLEANCYQIYVNDCIIHTYRKRIFKDAQAVSYSTNGQGIFTNPISVLVNPPAKPTSVQRTPATSYEKAYFTLTAEEVAKVSEDEPFDYVIIGSGIGGGILAADLLSKNKRLSASRSNFSTSSTSHCASSIWDPSSAYASANDPDDRTKRILVIERGNLLFPTHSLNMPRPTDRGTYGQMNDLFYNHFKHDWEMDDYTRKIWKGGPVYCLGGRSTVWGLFSPRIDDNTFRTYFPKEVYDDLNKTYLRKAEEWMNISYPQTLPLHRALRDALNLHPPGSRLPATQWEWGRVASEFRNTKNFDFAEGAYSTVDRLLEAAMDDQGKGKFKIVLNSFASHIEPKPVAGMKQLATHVVVKDESGAEHKIRSKNTVICAGAIESPAILLRSKGSPSISNQQAFGGVFAQNFGHVTDHYIFYVTTPFYYRNEKNREILGGIKLQTDITFRNIDNTTALANISLDASSFLPRRNVPDSELPQFIIAYILPSQLNRDNQIEIDDTTGQAKIGVGYAADPYLEEKKELLKDFAVDAMNKISASLDIQFVKHEASSADYTLLTKITKNQIELGELGPGGVAHELGSIPMPTRNTSRDAILDENLQMQYGWDNVFVCDLSVFPYSPAANPTLSLAALSLRLSDHLVPPEETRYQPIVIHNVSADTVYVTMTLSNMATMSYNPHKDPKARVEIKSGKSQTWKREQKETIFIYSSPNTQDFDVQIVHPGATTLITQSPPGSLAALTM
ncbi:FAD/NAD(P)-binding domain-containing protein [Xylogone sp. PMI_703]|nr:FAD/NAD(P)-binding domain-containing protein [Xylogone sp. PMI_703]